MRNRLRYFIQIQQESIRPKLFTVLKEGITREQWRKEIISGAIVGVVALPLAIAFAIASGVTPDKGLVTAVIAGFVISALGGSRVVIGGPTGAFIPIVYGIVQLYGVDGLVISTFMAGILLVLMGLARLGSIIKFIPYSLVVGFTTGIAVIIFSTQMRDFFGLDMQSVPTAFHEKWIAYFQSAGLWNPWAAALALGTVVLVFVFPRITTKIPGALVAILLFTAIAKYFQLPVETIESRFGDIPSSMPVPIVPHLDWATIQSLIRPALTIALLGAIESLLCCVVADSMIGASHRSNTELVAQGVANIGSSFFGGIPATGAIARTATNIKNGGRTPIAGITHALVLLMIMLFFGRWAKWIPLSVLAGIMIYVAYNMSEWRTFKALARGQRSDVVILLATFFLTVAFDLTVAIEVGVILSAFLFMRRMAEISDIRQVTEQMVDHEDGVDPDSINYYPIPKEVQVFEINGPLFFGVAHKFKEAMRRVAKPPKVMILRMRMVPAIDETGLHHLREFIKNLHDRKVKVILSGVSPQLMEELKDGNVLAIAGVENVFSHISGAVARANELLVAESESSA